MTDYPEPTVEPVLPSELATCNSQLPGGDVIEWFDFGQFVELMAVDTAGVSHPVVLANHQEIARAAGQLRQGDELPLRIVDVVGGIPLTEIVDEDKGSGERALAPIPEAREIVVSDVDELIRKGEVSSSLTTYRITLSQDEARRLGDGEHLTHAARLVEAGTTRDVTVRLAPEVFNSKVVDRESLLAMRTAKIAIDGTETDVDLRLEPAEVSALLAGATVIVRGHLNGQTRLVRLIQPDGQPAFGAARPKQTENTIRDLAAFLASPVIDGDDGRPFPLTLTKQAVHDLVETETTTLTLDGGTVVKLIVEKR